MTSYVITFIVFFFKYTATTQLDTYCHTLSLHAAFPILFRAGRFRCQQHEDQVDRVFVDGIEVDRRLQAGEQPIETVQLRQLAVRDADAGADAGGAPPLALPQARDQRARKSVP